MPFGKHLHRLRTIFANQPLYFITTCVADRKNTSLASPECKDIITAEWQSALEHYGWGIGSYVIMPDHVHFFCRPTLDAVTLSMFVGKLKERSAKRMKTTGLPGHLWQAGFFDHILRSDESYSEKWEYVRQNPVRAGLVQTPEEWPYYGHVHFT
jgi:putative transposase